MVFVGVKPFFIHEALRMMYGQTIQIAEKHLERFCAFLQLLEITFETSVAEGDDSAHLQKKPKLCKEAKIVQAANTSDFGVEESAFQNMVDVPEMFSSETSSADINVASASDEYATSARPRIFATNN